MKKNIVNDKIMGLTENEFIHYQSYLIGYVESVTIEEASVRECVGEEQSNTKLRRSSRARKRANLDKFTDVLRRLTRRVNLRPRLYGEKLSRERGSPS